MSKIKATFTIDEEINHLLGVKVNNRSRFVNDLLKEALFGEDDEEQALLNIKRYTKSLAVEKSRLRKIREFKSKEREITVPMNNILKWAEEVSPFNQITGERRPLFFSSIKNVCDKNKVNPDLAIRKLEGLGYNIQG